jgi:D-alanyl-D-alanine carboxypeptidase
MVAKKGAAKGASKHGEKSEKASQANADLAAQSVNQGENYAAADIVEASTEEHAVATTETKTFTGRGFDKQSKSENPRFYAVPRDKAYGESSPEEHRRSGYSLPDYFYDPAPAALAEHKMPGNGHEQGGAK